MNNQTETRFNDKNNGHVFHKCNDPNCSVCNGGLAYCDVCGGAENSLPNACPGYRMDDHEQALVASGNLNFVLSSTDGFVFAVYNTKDMQYGPIVLMFTAEMGLENATGEYYDKCVKIVGVQNFTVYKDKLALLYNGGEVVEYKMAEYNKKIVYNPISSKHLDIPGGRRSHLLEYLSNGELYLFKRESDGKKYVGPITQFIAVDKDLDLNLD